MTSDTTFPTIEEIRLHIGQFVNGETSYGDFQAWIIPETWDMYVGQDTELGSLIGETTFFMVEYLNGDWTTDELRELLRPFAFPATEAIPHA